jgi:Kef-type K+ transport system membrane component KefB
VNLRANVQFALVGAAVVLLAAGLLLSGDVSHPMDDLGWLALGVAVVLAAAIVGGHVAAALGQPAVLGELVAGMLLGNLPGLSAIAFIGTDPYLDILARVGMLLLLFEVGLGLSVRDLFAVGASSLLVAAIGTGATLTLGAAAAVLLLPNAAVPTVVFLAAAITATSVGITARVLKDLRASNSAEAKIILGAAVVDDVLALIVLGAVTAWVGTAGTSAFSAMPIVALVMKTTGFLVLAIVLGARLTPTWFRRAAGLRTHGALLAVGLCFCFVVSWAASAIGLAALVGAFAAGLVIEDAHSELFVQRGEPSLATLLQPMTSFLVPVFFVLVGIRTNLAELANPGLLVLAAALTTAGIVGKMSSGLGVLTPGVRRLIVGLGMMPQGEVALVFATLGRTLTINGAPVLDEAAYLAIVAVVVTTTLVTPVLLKRNLSTEMQSHRGFPRPAA